MKGTRERDSIQAFVNVSNELVDGYDIVDLFEKLTISAVRLLDVASAALLLAGQPVVVADLAAHTLDWPQFTSAAQSLGFASVHAVPMTLRDTVLGALGLFGTSPGTLDAGDLALAQALVHVASIALVNDKSAADRDVVNAQLQYALTSRILVEQARGILAHVGKVDVDTAFTVLRRYARDHGDKLSDVASRLIDRDLRGEDVIQHARSAAILP